MKNIALLGFLVFSCTASGAVQDEYSHTGKHVSATGVYRGHRVAFEIIDGMAVVEGDIILGPAEELMQPRPQEIKLPIGRKGALVRGDHSFLWSGGVIPYSIAAGFPNPSRVTQAVEHWNSNTNIQLVPRGGEANFVEFVPADSGCNSFVGMQGGRQEVRLETGCSLGNTIHEIGHTVGLFHEQSRADAASHIATNFDNIIRQDWDQFTSVGASGTDLGPYDFQSIMHYSALGFSRNGFAVFETIPPGLDIGQRNGLSPGDIDAVARMYGESPTRTVIDTNPTGLQVEVDGVTLTAPQSFDWAPGSTHTVNAVAPQSMNGERDLFGRWSDDGAQSHTVTANADTTVFTANFIVQLPFANSVSASGGGAIVLDPPPIDGFFTQRSLITVEAQPDQGFAFRQWSGVLSLTPPHGLSESPVQIQLFDGALDYQANFTQTPLTTFTSDPPRRVITVDGKSVRTPYMFPYPPGTQIDVSVAQQQAGLGGVDRAVFESWSDGGARAHTVTIPAQPALYSASLREQFLLTTDVFPADGGEIIVSPDRPDGFQDSGSTVELDAYPQPGFDLAFWLDDLTDQGSPRTLTMDRDRLARAIFTPSRALFSGVPQPLMLNAVGGPTLRLPYYIQVPEGATRLEIKLETSTPSADLDIHARYGEPAAIGTDGIIADYSSTSPTGSEMIVATSDSTPPLRAGTYFISVVQWTTGVAINATLTATFDGAAPAPVITLSTTSLSFSANEGQNPSPQIFTISNTGAGTLRHRITGDQPWLSASPDHGAVSGFPQTITVSVAPGTLPPGTYHGNLMISDEPGNPDAPAAAPAVLAVTLVVVGAGPPIEIGGILSAASYQSGAASEAIMALFGTDLAARTEIAQATPLPTLLADTSVSVTDGLGVSRLAPLFLVTPLQINFQIPAGTKAGRATITVQRQSGRSGSTEIQIEAVAPAVFTANAMGSGVAAGQFVHVFADGSTTSGLAFSRDVTGGTTSVPIDLGGPDDVVALVLFGTGIRGRSDLANVKVEVGGEAMQVLYAGPQSQYAGLDQVNVILNRTLIGRGQVTVVLTVDGKVANTVTITIGGSA